MSIGRTIRKINRGNEITTTTLIIRVVVVIKEDNLKNIIESMKQEKQNRGHLLK